MFTALARLPQEPAAELAPQKKPASKKRARPEQAPAYATISAIIGPVQSGKTSRIVQKIASSEGICVVILRNNTIDAHQFSSACTAAGVSYYHLASDKKLNAKCSPFRLPKVFVLIANYINLSKFRTTVVPGIPEDQQRFHFFIDEADKLALSSETTEKGYCAELGRVLEFAREIVLVTATTFNIMKSEYGPRLTPKNVDIIEPRPNYCGIHDIMIGDGTLDDPNSNEDDDVYIGEDEVTPDREDAPRVPPSLRRFLRYFADDVDGVCDILQELNVPRLGLVRLGFNLDSMISAAKESLKYPGVLPIVFTGEGVSVPPHVLQAFHERGVHLKCTKLRKSGQRFMTVVGVALPAFLTMIFDQRICGDRPKVCIFAGKLCARGVQMCDSEYKTSLTDEYFLPAKTTDVSELVQALRIDGNKPWDVARFRPRLMTKLSVLKNMASGMHVQETAIHNLTSRGYNSLSAAVRDGAVPEAATVKYAPLMPSGCVPEEASLVSFSALHKR